MPATIRLMNKLRALVTVICSLAIISAPALAVAQAHSSSQSGGSTTSQTGNDVSWPQCGKSLPKGQLFGIVGVNGGLANTNNPCFSTELTWANNSLGTTKQPKAALYVNTANPGDVTPTVADWPKNNVDAVNSTTDTDPYGACTGGDDLACSWQYGYNMANLDANTRNVPSPQTYTWYLDVETGNSWTNDTAKNAADLEGMTTYFQNIGAVVGLYSTSSQWNAIVGSHGNTDNLNNLISWLPGARSFSGAQADCGLPPLTVNGKVTVTQYVSKQTDYDVSCL